MKRSLFAAVFTERQTAEESAEIIRQLNEEGVIKLFSYAIASKGDGGELEIVESKTPGARGALITGILGGLAGLVGGPAVAAFGTAAGALSGAWFDLTRVEERNNFSAWVAGQVSEGRFALLAEAMEPESTVKDRIEKQISTLGGRIIP